MSNGRGLPGRRERKLTATRGAIFEAATTLFQERPYEAVTVQQIAERADVGVGTLFYHAPNKAEMFLMVYNVVLERAIAQGEDAQESLPESATPTALVMALILPLARLRDSSQASNLARYHRELLFGGSDGPHRREGIELVRRLERRLAAALATPDVADPDGAVARLAARSVFAALHFDIALAGTPLNEGAGFIRPDGAHLEAQVDIIVRGFAVRAAAQGPAPSSTPPPPPIHSEKGL